MRKSLKTFLSMVLVLIMMLSLAACGNNNANNGNNGGASDDKGGAGQTAEVKKPEKITILVDGTIFTEENGRGEFEKALEALTGVDYEFIQPDHSAYYDVLSQTFAGSDWPDVVLLGASYYAGYANNGSLADITECWANSDVLASGRVKNTALIDGLKIDGKLYGISPTRGNGCLTYIRKSWMDNVGITKAPTTYAEYTALLDKFAKGDPDGDGVPGNTYAVTAAGLIGGEAPYTNYLPEFYQGAYPDFYEKEDGTWVDGFTEQAMADALERLTEAYDNGWLDPEIVTNATSDCRNKFYGNTVGVFTYWAGTWAYNLQTNLATRGQNSDLVMLQPIAEVKNYIERQAVVWAITSKCDNVQGVFDYFFEPMLDGGDGQILWTYGVEDVHWSTKAEDCTIGEGDKAKTTTYEAGVFHFRPNLEDGSGYYKKNHIDPMLSIASFKGEDIGLKATDPIALEAADIFNNVCVSAPVIVSTNAMNEHLSTILSLRKDLVTKVVTQGMSVEDAFAEYNKQVGDKVALILSELNK